MAFTKKDCKNVTMNGICDKTAFVKLRNLLRRLKFYMNPVCIVQDILQLCKEQYSVHYIVHCTVQCTESRTMHCIVWWSIQG